MMTDGDDSVTWLSSALRHVELAAHQIARFTNPWWDPTWQDLVPCGPPPPLTVGWTTRGRRSRSTRKLSAATADDDCICSPETPLDFGSGSGSGSRSGLGCGSGWRASTSGGEDGFGLPKRMRVADGGDVSCGCEMKVGQISVATDIRRTGRKKTLCELQEEERLLLEKKNQLQKEMEMRVKVYEGLRAENQRLKSQQVSFPSGRRLVKSAVVSASFDSPSSSSCFILPDLNEPLVENFN